MQLKTYFFLLLAAIFAISARAEAQTVENFSEYVEPYVSWGQKYSDDREVLNIFPAFQPPTFRFILYGVEETRVEQYHVYVTKMAVTVKKGAANLPLANLINFETIKRINKELRHKNISANETLTLKAGRGPINNFQWCNDGIFVDYFKLPQRETNLSYMVNPQRPWCQGSTAGRSICLETCYPFHLGWKAAVAAENARKDDEDRKDYGIAMQSEMRYFVSEAEYGSKIPLARLTGLNTPVRGVLEQNIFYFNQVLAWGKVVAIFQEHPTNAQQTVMSIRIAFNLRSKYWNHKYRQVREILQGKSTGRLGLNTATGISSGIPNFSKEIAIDLVKILEN